MSPEHLISELTPTHQRGCHSVSGQKLHPQQWPFLWVILHLGNVNFPRLIFGSHWLDIFTKSQQGKSNKQGYPLCNYLSHLPLSPFLDISFFNLSPILPWCCFWSWTDVEESWQLGNSFSQVGDRLEPFNHSQESFARFSCGKNTQLSGPWCFCHCFIVG